MAPVYSGVHILHSVKFMTKWRDSGGSSDFTPFHRLSYARIDIPPHVVRCAPTLLIVERYNPSVYQPSSAGRERTAVGFYLD